MFALNTSAVYIGRAFGSAVGGVLFAAERYSLLGPAAALFMLVGMAVLISTHRPSRAA